MTIGRIMLPDGHSVVREADRQGFLRGSFLTFWKWLLLSGLLFLPGVLGFFFEGTSFATGTAIICLLALMLAAIGVIPLSSRDILGASTVASVAVFIVVVHLLIANVINNDASFDLVRALLSLLLLGIVGLGVPVFAKAIMANGRLGTIVWTMLGLFFISAVFSLLKVQPLTSNLGEKPTFPFTEPSFLGFSLAATLIFTMIRSPQIVRIFIFLAFIGLGYSLSNLTIITTCVLAAMVSLPMSWLVSGVVIVSISAASLDLTYYTDRLDLNSANSTNLSSLVYVQGWQMLQESLQRTYGWGIGFQQLGVVYTNVLASIRINALLGRDANLQDGGFILSKLGSEFGLLGFALTVFYLRVTAYSFLRLRQTALGKIETPDGELFARACVTGYLIETFIRGTNYFTGTLVLMLAGLLHLHHLRKGSRT